MSTGQSNPSIEVLSVSKGFRSGTRDIVVLKDISLNVYSGETVSIRGESGSGKTTLLNCMAAIESVDTGAVHWEGQDISEYSRNRLPIVRASHLGFVFQAYYLIPELNALENVLLPVRMLGGVRYAMREKARALMVKLGLEERLDAMPEKLSGGERQRVAIARAMINDPNVILADEPTGNLDEVTAGRVMEELFNLVRERGTGLVLVTHHPGFAGMAERRMFLSKEGLANA